MRKETSGVQPLYIYFFLIVFISFGFGLDPGYSQFYANPLGLNPAFLLVHRSLSKNNLKL